MRVTKTDYYTKYYIVRLPMIHMERCMLQGNGGNCAKETFELWGILVNNFFRLPCLGSHLTIWLAGSKQAFVISATDSCSW